jgi:hypothetical protein
VDLNFLEESLETCLGYHIVFDIIFISYNEPNAEKNLDIVRQRFPLVKHVSGIKGIHQAHIVAAKRSFTPMFWVIDADAVLLDSFNFNYQITKEEYDIVHVWRSRNPINNLEYGYGGVKLLPKNLTINMDVSNTDMTTSISTRFKVVDEISNITAFNTDPFSTWRSAFRECCKLSSRSISGQVDEETISRLTTWCTVASGDYAEYAVKGALAGQAYGQENAGNIPALSLINNFDWLMSQFQQSC